MNRRLPADARGSVADPGHAAPRTFQASAFTAATPIFLAITDVFSKQAAATRLRLVLTSSSPCETFFPSQVDQCYLSPTFQKGKKINLNFL